MGSAQRSDAGGETQGQIGRDVARLLHAAVRAAGLVRDLVGAMPEGRALLVAARVETQSVVQFHVRDARSAWSELDDLLKESAEGERQPAGALMFSCVGRGKRLYGEVGHDSRVLWQHFDALSPSGFFGNGEIGQVGGRTWVHGYTTAIILFRPGSDA